MQLPRSHVFTHTISLTGLILLALGANASPLPRDAATGGEVRAEKRFSDADLVLSDARLELPDGSAGLQGQLLGTPGGRALVADGASFDFGRVANPSGGSMQGMLRGFITVRRAASASGPAGAQPSPRSNPSSDDSLGLDLGLSGNEWIRDSVQGVMTSVLQLNVNERGQASFSVLGLGDFSVILSGDRSEIAFQAGDEIIMAQRTAHVQGAGGAYSRGYADGSSAPIAGGAGTTGSTESPIQRALNLILEVASHPLSIILYGLIGAYAIAWGILSSRSRRRPLRVASSRHVSSPHSLAYAARAVPAAAAPVAKKSRKRIRVRVRARKHR